MIPQPLPREASLPYSAPSTPTTTSTTPTAASTGQQKSPQSHVQGSGGGVVVVVGGGGVGAGGGGGGGSQKGRKNGGNDSDAPARVLPASRTDNSISGAVDGVSASGGGGVSQCKITKMAAAGDTGVNQVKSGLAKHAADASPNKSATVQQQQQKVGNQANNHVSSNLLHTPGVGTPVGAAQHTVSPPGKSTQGVESGKKALAPKDAPPRTDNSSSAEKKATSGGVKDKKQSAATPKNSGDKVKEGGGHAHAKPPSTAPPPQTDNMPPPRADSSALVEDVAASGGTPSSSKTGLRKRGGAPSSAANQNSATRLHPEGADVGTTAIGGVAVAAEVVNTGRQGVEAAGAGGVGRGQAKCEGFVSMTQASATRHTPHNGNGNGNDNGNGNGDGTPAATASPQLLKSAAPPRNEAINMRHSGSFVSFKSSSSASVTPTQWHDSLEQNRSGSSDAEFQSCSSDSD